MVPVIWHAQEFKRGYYNCTNMMNLLFDRYECWHYGRKNTPTHLDGAVVIVHGGRQLGQIDALNIDIDRLKWVLLVFLGDEEGSFPIEEVQHPNKIVWIQEPRFAHRHGKADRYIIDGWPPQLDRFMQTGRAHILNRGYDWFFGGQVTHNRRKQCVQALRSMDWGGVIVESKGYCQGISSDEYYRMMTNAYVVPCPSGPFSPDAARPWEALQCGAIPILDELSPVREKPGFWEQVLGESHPLPTIRNWDELPEMIKYVRGKYEETWPEISAWWANYIRQFYDSLAIDVRKLQERA